jgi:hypothetical protein
VDASVREVAQFLNTQTPVGSLVETYDSELFFLLNRPYHYPPDDLNIKFVRRTFLYQDATNIDYNPLAADPDYLILGPHSRQWKLYDGNVGDRSLSFSSYLYKVSHIRTGTLTRALKLLSALFVGTAVIFFQLITSETSPILVASV